MGNWIFEAISRRIGLTKNKMILMGNNLGERHRDLNSKVAEAAIKQTNFEELKTQTNNTDIDMLFKIDLASKYKEIDYILEILKCGDVFYITRALKCLWLYSDEYSQFINTDYLETNIFSCMSEKMKRKMLTSISTHMTNSNRAIDFYNYCRKAKLEDYAAKFLINTPDHYKLELLMTRQFKDFNVRKSLNQFVGGSFLLAQAYLRVCGCNSSGLVHKLRFLYTVSDEKYLKIMEGHIKIDAKQPNRSHLLGTRISRDILKRHKQRILENPLLYVNVLNKSMLVKHLTAEDVKSLMLALLPSYSNEFWSMDFYNTYKFILQKFPANELLVNLKEIYVSKYKDDTFEMSIEFYNLKYYELFNIDEREAWALLHIERDEELPGIEYYIWYKFVSFKKAFSGIKRYIYLTPDKNERSRIVNTLPETARNGEDINNILSYYYERHVNESEEHKESFVNKIIEVQDVYSFNNECWTSLDKLLHSLDVYTTECYVKEEYKFRSTIYHILHSKELPDILKEYINYTTRFYHITSLIEELSEERKAFVAKYLLSYYTDKIKCLMDEPDYKTGSDEIDYWDTNTSNGKIHELVNNIWNIISTFHRTKEDCPEIVLQYMESHRTFYEYHEIYKPKFEKSTEEDFVRWLKQDVETAVDGIYEIRCNTYRWNFRLSRLFRKLKVYFPNDVGKGYLTYFMDYLSDIPPSRREYRNIKMAVVGLFYLGDPNTIVSFLDKNVPTSPKIDHRNIDNRVLQVQKAICRLAYHPRPPIPLCNFQKYITGDYVHFCLPVFYNYFSNLPSNEKFIEILLDAPLSIQKHGLRFAFKAYDTDILIPIITSAWKKTENVSLRMLLYETLFNRILNDTKEVQKQLYEVLKLYTMELNHDDHDDVYSLLVSDKLPDLFKGDFIETAWITVSKLPTKSVDVNRRISVIQHMENNMHLVHRDFLRLQIIDDHVNDMLLDKKISKDYEEYHFKELIIAKWNLTAKYIITFSNEVDQIQSLELMETIMSLCMKSWDLVKRNTYIIRKFLRKLIDTIMENDPNTIQSCLYTMHIYQCILDNLQKYLNGSQIYLINWELQLSITSRNIINNGRLDSDDDERKYYMSDVDIADAYGKKVVDMLIKSMKNKKFYRCFYQSIANIVKKTGYTICDTYDVCSDGFLYNVCNRLTDTKMIETHILALFMLPTDPKCNYESEHIKTITKLKQFNSREVRSFLYQKFAVSDCQVRSYIT